MTTFTYIDNRNNIIEQFVDLLEYLEWQDQREKNCSHEQVEHRTATTKRGVYHALRCMNCYAIVKSWKE